MIAHSVEAPRLGASALREVLPALACRQVQKRFECRGGTRRRLRGREYSAFFAASMAKRGDMAKRSGTRPDQAKGNKR